MCVFYTLTMNLRIYLLCATQLLMLVLLLANLYSILHIIPPEVFTVIFVICFSFPAVTVVLLISIFEVYRAIRLPI